MATRIKIGQRGSKQKKKTNNSNKKTNSTSTNINMAAAFVQFEKFDTEVDKANLGNRWKKWLTRFEFCLTAAGITNDDRMKANLINCAGEQVFDIYESLTITPRVAAGAVPAETNYEATKRALSDYFNPSSNTEYHIYKFRAAKQLSSESVDEFSTRLMKLAEHCSFANKEQEIKSQIIQSCRSKKLRREALQNKQWDLKSLLDQARTVDLVDRQAAEIEDQDSLSVNNVNKLQNKHKQKHQHQPECSYCGNKFHRDGLQSCPARGKVCNYCKKLNHFVSQCFAAKRSDQQTNKDGRKQKFVAAVTVESDDSDFEADM